MSQIHSVQSQVKAGRTLVDKAFSENLSALVLLTALEVPEPHVSDRRSLEPHIRGVVQTNANIAETIAWALSSLQKLMISL